MPARLPVAGGVPAHEDTRRVVVYVGGSIAAIKAGALVTGLRGLGCEVRVAMTQGAMRFVTPLTFRALSGYPVATDAAIEAVGDGLEHLDLAGWCDAQAVVAASANLIARLALGLADDVVTTTALAATAPMVIAPAMETSMWNHPATRANVATLTARGALIVGPVAGRLASGREGLGRMADPEDIAGTVAAVLRRRH